MSNNPFFRYLERDTYYTLINVIKKNITVQVSPKEPSRRVNFEKISSKVLEDILREYIKKSRYSEVTKEDFEEIVNIALSKNRVLEKEGIQVKEWIYTDLLREIGKFNYSKLKNALIYAILINKESQRERDDTSGGKFKPRLY